MLPCPHRIGVRPRYQWLKTSIQQVAAVEAEPLALLERRFAQEMTLLCSILGIGRKTAGMLPLFADGFPQFDNYPISGSESD